jgi:hypothetical protein
MKEQKNLFSRHVHSVVLGWNTHAQSRKFCPVTFPLEIENYTTDIITN